MSRTVLGVDPGLSETGWAVIEPEGPSTLAASGLIETPASMPLGARLRRLHEAVLAVLDEHRPVSVAIEQLFFMRSTRSMAATSQARGVILLAAELRSIEVAEYNPRDVKLSIAGHGGAQKAQMQKMVQLLLRLREPLRPDDVADAAAIALCHARARRFKGRLAGAAR